MNAPILLHELTREKARELAPQTLLVLPVGAVEQHGPHLPVGTDFLTVEHVARGAAKQARETIPVWSLPPCRSVLPITTCPLAAPCHSPPKPTTESWPTWGNP